MAVQAAAKIIGDGKVSNRNVTVLSDRMKAIKALSSNVMNSKRAYDCRRYLNEIAKRYDIHIISYIPGSCKTDELARRHAIIELPDQFSNLGISMRFCKLIINNAIVDSISNRWAAWGACRTARKISPKLDERLTISLLKL